MTLATNILVSPNGTTSPELQSCDFDPSVTGLVAPIGSLALRTDELSLYTKTGAGNTAWTRFVVMAAQRDWFGDGSDGDVTISSPTTLSRDMFYNTLVVNASIDTGGYRIFVKELLTLNTLIHRDGNDASGNTGGAATSAGLLAGGAAGAVGGILFAPPGTGGASTTAPHEFSSVANGGAGNGGTGGAGQRGQGGGGGGGDSIGADGGPGGTITTSPTNGDPHFVTSAIRGRGFTSVFTAGSGGGGGRGRDAPGAGNGGGGGGGAGVVVVVARRIIGIGTIRARGGVGGNGVTAGGGGGGGGGGVVICGVGTGSFPALNVLGGTAGSGVGVNFGNGGDGGAGLAIALNL